MRRPSSVEVMLLFAITLWALNLSITRYVLTHGFLPLAYSSVRYGLASVLFVGITLVSERSLRLPRRDLVVALTAALVLYLNQIGFVYSLRTTSASVIALLLAAAPFFAALVGLALGRERGLQPRFWLGTALSIVGVAVVALAAGGAIEGSVQGVLFGLLAAATWALYSILIAPLMQRHSAMRISAVVIPVTWIPITLTGLPQLQEQDWSLGSTVWGLLLLATLGPLVLTNVLWFRALDRIGPARATLATNLQPFLAAVMAIVLLGEPIDPQLLLGGALIGAGIMVARGRRGSRSSSAPPVVPPPDA